MVETTIALEQAALLSVSSRSFLSFTFSVVDQNERDVDAGTGHRSAFSQ
jgi:hypothetical protein